jgi:hypothetical protein
MKKNCRQMFSHRSVFIEICFLLATESNFFQLSYDVNSVFRIGTVLEEDEEEGV